MNLRQAVVRVAECMRFVNPQQTSVDARHARLGGAGSRRPRSAAAPTGPSPLARMPPAFVRLRSAH